MSLYVSKRDCFFFRQCRPGVLLLNAEKHFLKRTNSRLGRTCTLHVCLLYALQAKSALIDVTKGVGGVSPKQIFCKQINRDKQLLKKLFYCSLAYTLMFQRKKIIFPGDFNPLVPAPPEFAEIICFLPKILAVNY